MSKGKQQQKRQKPRDIFEAVEQSDQKAIKEFIERMGVLVSSVNDHLQTPAHIAAIKGNLKIFQYLVEKDPTVLAKSDLSGHYIPLLAVDHDHLDLVKYLVKNHVTNLYQHYDYMGSTIVHRAAELGRLSILKYLVEEKQADINVINKFMQPPIFLAAENKQSHIIRYLVEEQNASLTMMDEHQHTILHIAVNNDDLTLMKYVLDERKADLDVNMTNTFGITLVQRAVDLNHLEVLVYLVDRKHANINMVNVWGESPLHSAARENHYEVFKYLVEHGADMKIRDHQGGYAIQKTTDDRIRTYIATLKKRHQRSLIQVSSNFYLSVTHPTTPISQHQLSSLVHFKSDTFAYFNRLQTLLTLVGPIVAIVKCSLFQGSFLSQTQISKDKMDQTAMDSIDNFLYKFE